MKRLSEMTIRERGRWLYGRQAIGCMVMLIVALWLQLWWVVALVLACGVLVYFSWRNLERYTRDDPPHANY